MGTWNVLTMLKPGKMQEIAEQIQNTSIQIVALQEIRWKGCGHIKKQNYSLYYSCNPDITGHLGTGFLVKKETEKNILGFEPYNDRICKLRMKGKYHNLSLLCVHAPTEDSDNIVKEQFFEELQKVQDRIPKHDVVILLGDMNAKIGLEDAYSSVTGKHSLHVESNSNGEFICEYAAANNMYIMSTKFKHKIHKGTWVTPDGNTCNQIDHVLVNQNKSSMIQDVRTLRRSNYNSDHFLVKVKMIQTLIRMQNNNNIQRKQWNRKNLQSKEKLKQYRQSLYNKLETMKECEDANIEWQQIKDSVLNAATEVIQSEYKKPQNEWWDEECRMVIEEKNLARMKCLNRRTRINQNNYK